MDAVEYLKEKLRMTHNCYGSCPNCLLSSYNNGTKKSCVTFEAENTKQAVAIVEQWAKENPRKTYLSVLLEKFPNAEINVKNIPTICPHRIFGKSGMYVNCDSNLSACVKCWNREYKEE